MSEHASLGCAEVEPLVPELATATLAGRPRADALEHLDRCAPCRRLADDLTRVADSLLLLAPADDPGPAFTARVTAAAAAVAEPRPAPRAARRDRGRAVVAAAAIAVLVVALAGFAAGRQSDVQVRTGMARLGPGAWCRAVAFGDGPARVLVSMDMPGAPDEEYVVRGRLRTGQPGVRLGVLHLRDGHGTLSAEIEGRAADLVSVQVATDGYAVVWDVVFDG